MKRFALADTKDEGLDSHAAAHRIALCALLGFVFGLDIMIGVSLADYAAPATIAFAIVMLCYKSREDAWTKTAYSASSKIER